MRHCRLAMSFGLAVLFATPAAPQGNAQGKAPQGKAPAAAPSAAPTLARDVQPIFDRACAECHGTKTHKAKLDLSSAMALQSLVNTPSDEVPEMPRVQPGDPGMSYLWQKLQNTAPKGKGMPRGWFSSKRLPEAELETIRKWIEAGAPR